MRKQPNIEEIVELMRKDDSVDAPPDSLKWAKNLIRTRIAEPKTSPLRRLVAVLQMELMPNKAIAGERSASAAAARQMLFNAGDAAVDLRVQKTGSRLSVAGQILGDGFEGATVILKSGEKSYTETASEMCEFKFEKVSAGVYDLTVLTNNAEIFIEKIDLA